MPALVPTGLDPRTSSLPNGIRVLAKQTRTTPAVTINLALEAGSVYDPDERPGVAFFLSRVMDRGTRARSAEAIAEDLDLRGISLRVAATRHMLTLSCDCLAEDFDSVMALIADIIREPTCPDAEVETRRVEVLTAIRQDADNPATMALERLMSLLYGSTHPFGRSPKGTPLSVNQIDREMLLRFHHEHVSPSDLSIVVVGDVAAEHAIATVVETLSTWTLDGGGRRALDSPPPASVRQRVVVPMMNKSQADIAYGFTTIARVDPAYHAYWLMSNIFGQYGMGGRLGSSIRERQGMAYYVFCGFEAGVIVGPLIVRAGVSGQNVDTALASIDREVSLLAADGVTNEELANSKRYLVGSLPRTLETNAGVAAFLQNVQQFDLGLDYDQRLPDLISRVTRDAVNDAARRTLSPDRAAVVIAGPYEDHATDS